MTFLSYAEAVKDPAQFEGEVLPVEVDPRERDLFPSTFVSTGPEGRLKNRKFTGSNVTTSWNSTFFAVPFEVVAPPASFARRVRVVV